MTTSMKEFSRDVEQAISETLGSATKNEWDENHLTLEWLKKVRTAMHGTAVEWRGERRQISSRLFKLKGPLEKHHGDVAFLVKILFQDQEVLEGVGFLEAKIRHWSTDRFPALKTRQLETQYSRTKNARVVLYDRAPSPFGAGCVDHAWFGRWDSENVWPDLRPVTNALVVPMALLLFGTSRRNRTVYRFAAPLSCHIAHRLILGLDLELAPELIESTRKAADRGEAATTIMSLVVRVSGSSDGAVTASEVSSSEHLVPSGEYEELVTG